VVSFTPSAALSLRKEIPVTQWTGGWVGPRASLDAMVGEKKTALQGIKPQSKKENSKEKPDTLRSYSFPSMCN